jgi:hypothetical protein
MDYSLLIGFHFTDRETPQPPNPQDVVLNLDDSPYALSGQKFVSYQFYSAIKKNEGLMSEDGKEIYFIGLIDTLQSYNFDKKTERCLKVNFLCKDRVNHFMKISILTTNRRVYLYNQQMFTLRDL